MYAINNNFLYPEIKSQNTDANTRKMKTQEKEKTSTKTTRSSIHLISPVCEKKKKKKTF